MGATEAVAYSRKSQMGSVVEGTSRCLFFLSQAESEAFSVGRTLATIAAISISFSDNQMGRSSIGDAESNGYDSINRGP